MQLSFVHQLIQARLSNSGNPVQEVFNCLHFFCQSLQLEVLYGQTMHLKHHRLNDSVQVEEYVRGQRLTVSYWRDGRSTAAHPHHQHRPASSTEFRYRLTVQADPVDPARPLTVFHLPTIGNREANEMAARAVHTDQLSMERLLVHTVYIRSLARLGDMRTEFRAFLRDAQCEYSATNVKVNVRL